MTQRLDRFTNSTFDRGRPVWVEVLWILTSILTVASRFPGSRLRIAILRAFGARIGTGVVIKAGVRVKFPWRLTIGDYSWIGEDSWIDNLAPVEIGAHVCISQGCYLCTGNHDWSRSTFDLIVSPITVHSGGWLGAMSSVAPGVTIGPGTVVAMGSVVITDLPANMVCRGNPAVAHRHRSSQPE